jgi:diguanylate cyclase (GGDEF)-like protein
VQAHSLQRKQAQHLAALAAAEDAERLRFAARASGVAVFDWSVAEDLIRWDGAIDLLPYHHDPERVRRGSSFLNWLSADARNELAAVLENRSSRQASFDLDLDGSSAMGPVWFTFVGTRIPGASGQTERITGVMRMTTERQRETQRLTYLATRDELTGHLNRNSLRAELAQAVERAKAEERNCAFLVASIDRLAVINDGYGLDAGDEVIVAVGERLSKALRSGDIIGRTAGNKFGVILGDCSEREITLVADRLRSAVRESVIDTRSGQVSATSSVGAVWLPTNASSSQEAMLRAEAALDRARSAGRDGFSVYQKSPQRDMARLRLMGIADEVVSALNDNRLVFAYQPIVDASTGEATHYECLLRMIRPDGTIATAGQFIPAAEQMGLVRLVDRRAIEMTIAELHAHPTITLGVNVSGTTAADGAWLTTFIDYVRANRAVAPRLIVELTETAALHHFEESAQFVSQLRELGCRVAIDDFGAGYTSFRNLRMLRVDMVKIDGAYVDNLSASPENQIFVRTLVGLARSFNLKTVAEWVSSDEDAALLQSFGVDYFQGFHFGEPVLKPVWMKG